MDALITLDKLRLFECSHLILTLIIDDSRRADYHVEAVVKHRDFLKSIVEAKGSILKKYLLLQKKLQRRKWIEHLDHAIKELEESQYSPLDDQISFYDNLICAAVLLSIKGEYKYATKILEKLYRNGVSLGDGYGLYRGSRAILAIEEDSKVDDLLYHSINVAHTMRYDRSLQYDTYSSLVSYLIGLARKTRKDIGPSFRNLKAHAIFGLELVIPTVDVSLSEELIYPLQDETYESLSWVLKGLREGNEFAKALALPILLAVEKYSTIHTRLRTLLDMHSVAELSDLAKLAYEQAGLKCLSLLCEIVSIIHDRDFTTMPIDDLQEVEHKLQISVNLVRMNEVISRYSIEDYHILRKYVVPTFLNSLAEKITYFKSQSKEVFERAGIDDEVVVNFLKKATIPGGPLDNILANLAPQNRRNDVTKELIQLTATKMEDAVLEVLALVRERAQTVRNIEQLMRRFNEKFRLPNPRPTILYLAPPIPPELYSLLSVFIAGVLAEWAVGKILDEIYERAGKEVGFSEEDREKIKITSEKLTNLEKEVQKMHRKIDDMWRKSETERK